ncbi:hypothetical protein ANN_13905 [Periplaneta americana]|uniref:Secreted protein n=1 Tax=Periplaneta americana TaxID=6978 RepID=A0ABQ8SUU0_PERAM|nr:hypothetical protein ANN_13905 [Periplaneta americana]
MLLGKAFLAGLLVLCASPEDFFVVRHDVIYRQGIMLTRSKHAEYAYMGEYTVLRVFKKIQNIVYNALHGRTVGRRAVWLQEGKRSTMQNCVPIVAYVTRRATSFNPSPKATRHAHGKLYCVPVNPLLRFQQRCQTLLKNVMFYLTTLATAEVISASPDVPEFCPAGVLLHASKSTDMSLRI